MRLLLRRYNLHAEIRLTLLLDRSSIGRIWDLDSSQEGKSASTTRQHLPQESSKFTQYTQWNTRRTITVPLIVTPLVRPFVQLRHRRQSFTPLLLARRRGTRRARSHHGPRRPRALKGRRPLGPSGAH